MQLILEQAVIYKNSGVVNYTPSNHGGHNLLIWGAEDFDSRYGRYGCLFVEDKNERGDKIRFLEFFANSFRERTFDFGHFWHRGSRVNTFLEISAGKSDGFSESDLLEIAELIKAGFLKRDRDNLNLCVPVYTATQYEQVVSLVDTEIKKLAGITRQLLEISTDILLQHTPISLKKQAKEIGWLKRHDIAMSGPVEIMRSNGVLRRVGENERPAVYVVLK